MHHSFDFAHQSRESPAGGDVVLRVLPREEAAVVAVNTLAVVRRMEVGGARLLHSVGIDCCTLEIVYRVTRYRVAL